MKHYLWIFLSILLLISSCHVKSQENIEITYDFKSKKLHDFDAVKLGKTVSFKIENINRFIYEAQITAKNIEYITEPSDLFKRFFQTQLEDDSVAMGLSKDFNEIKVDINSIKVQGITQNEADSILKKYNKTVNLLKNKAELIVKNYNKLECIKLFKNKLVILSLDPNLTHSYASFKLKILESDCKYWEKADSLVSLFDYHYKDLKEIHKGFSSDTNFIKIYESSPDSHKNNIQVLINESDRLKVKVHSFDYKKLVSEISILYYEISQENNYFIMSDPVQAEKDVVKFQIKINSRSNADSIAVLEQRDFPITIPIRGGVKIDFSTGLFFSKCLYDRPYFTTRVDWDTSMPAEDSLKVTIHEGENNNFGQVAIGALMHISPRWVKNFKPAFSFGVAIPVSDEARINIYSGLSCMWGKHRKFIASAGVAFGPVEYLQSKYTVGKNYYPEDLTEGMTEKVWKAGWFISLTYNLTNEEKD